MKPGHWVVLVFVLFVLTRRRKVTATIGPIGAVVDPALEAARISIWAGVNP